MQALVDLGVWDDWLQDIDFDLLNFDEEFDEQRNFVVKKVSCNNFKAGSLMKQINKFGMRTYYFIPKFPNDYPESIKANLSQDV